MSSAGEGEAVTSYMNCKAALPLRVALEEMGHPQPQTPVIMDNTSAVGLAQNTMTPKRSKAYDARVNWLKCREAQKQFKLIWESGKRTRQITTQKFTQHVNTNTKEKNMYETNQDLSS